MQPKDTFATLLWTILGLVEAVAEQNSHRVFKWREFEQIEKMRGRKMWQGEMWGGVKWLCALVAMSCNSVPDIATIQSAYEREASAGSSFHDNGLQVMQAKCQTDGGRDKFLCEVTFISKGDAERPYFDIVSMARAGEGWEISSGL